MVNIIHVIHQNKSSLGSLTIFKSTKVCPYTLTKAPKTLRGTVLGGKRKGNSPPQFSLLKFTQTTYVDIKYK